MFYFMKPLPESTLDFAGGDLYEQQEGFFTMVEKRPEDYATKWLETLEIPVIYVDGTETVERNVKRIIEKY